MERGFDTSSLQKKNQRMIKKLLSSIYKIFSYEYDRMRIEKYLSQSENTYDLEIRIRELEKSGKYNKFYI